MLSVPLRIPRYHRVRKPDEQEDEDRHAGEDEGDHGVSEEELPHHPLDVEEDLPHRRVVLLGEEFPRPPGERLPVREDEVDEERDESEGEEDAAQGTEPLEQRPRERYPRPAR